MRTDGPAEGGIEGAVVKLGGSFEYSDGTPGSGLSGNLEVRYLQLVLPGLDEFYPVRERGCWLDISCKGFGTLEGLETTLLQALRDVERAMGAGNAPGA